MPRHDPVPHHRQADYERAAIAWERFTKMMRRMVILAFAAVGLALLYVKLAGGPVPLHMAVATIAGVALMVLVGTGLMGLVFLSRRSRHADAAAHGERDDDR